MPLGFIIGLSVGAIALAIYRRRYDTRLKRLLERLEDRHLSSNLGYDAQIASAFGDQRSRIEELDLQLKDRLQMLQHMPVGYLQVDEESRLLWYNRRAQEYLNIEQTDYERPRLLLAVVRSYELDQLIERTRKTQQVCEAFWTFNSISTDPSNYLERPAYPLQGYGVPMRNAQVGVFLENKQEAVTLAQQRDRWMSDVAHELKTPLTSIRLVAETLQSRVAPELTSWVERLLKEVIRLSNLVDDVLKISSLEQAKAEVQDETQTDLIPLIKSVWQGVEPLAKLKQLRLAYEGPVRLIATVNSGLVHSVLFNLLSNAVKYSPAEEPIVVRLSVLNRQQKHQSPTQSLVSQPPASQPSAKNILLEVIDSGPGFNEKDLPHVFDRFYRGDSARSRGDRISDSELESMCTHEMTSSGTGLGLSIVQQIVGAHQGRVKAKNHPEMGGAWLQVWLPGKRLIDVSFAEEDPLQTAAPDA